MMVRKKQVVLDNPESFLLGAQEYLEKYPVNDVPYLYYGDFTYMPLMQSNTVVGLDLKAVLTMYSAFLRSFHYCQYMVLARDGGFDRLADFPELKEMFDLMALNLISLEKILRQGLEIDQAKKATNEFTKKSPSA